MEILPGIISISISVISLIIAAYVAIAVCRRLKSALYALFVWYAIHYERIVYIFNSGEKNVITWGSMEIESVSSLISSYLSMTDRNEKRRELIIELYDFSFQVAFHLNMPVKERHHLIEIKGEMKPAYTVAFSFAKDKKDKYLEKLEKLAALMPPIDLCDRMRKMDKTTTYAQTFLQSRIQE